MQAGGAEIQSIFQPGEGLRSRGEVFLADAAGRFLTAARYSAPSASMTPAGAGVEPRCGDAPSVVFDIDYRGVQTIHGLQPVAALDGGCVHAHMQYDEALAPANELWNNLVLRGGVFALLGALLSLLAAQRIAAPVRRLATSARRLEGGQLHLDIPVGGPAEVHELGLALQGMANELSQRIDREQAARHEAEAANRAKDEFLATVSHELRTPLSAILGWSRLLRTSHGDPRRSMRAVDAIERNADMQRRLIEDLLDVTRIVAKKIHLVQTPVKMSAIVEKALDAVRPQAADKAVRLETAFEEDLMVMGDPDRLQQVVLNLASNAIKFTPSGGWVRLTSHRAGPDTVELSVRDNGEGIRASFLPHVFDWFRQANPAGRGTQSGLGLGLGIVKYLTQLHGGSIRAESAGEGHGSAFVVRLPLYVEPPVEEPAPQAPALEHLADTRLDAVRVLVVDDDEETREVLRALLEEAGATVETANGAEAARRTLNTSAPDVLISDIAMPDEDGYTLIRSLRASNVTTPAIALTAMARREDTAPSAI
jgi:signal transduction histidine kinase